MDTKKQAIARAIAYLNAANCTYHIVDGNGKEVADTTAKAPTPKRKRYASYMQHYNGYIKRVDNGQGSFSVTIPIPEQYDVARYRGALLATLNNRYGKGNLITHVNSKARTVELMVVRPEV